MSELNNIALKILKNGKGILAADESTGTMTKRLDGVNVPSTPENRLLFRETLFSASGMSKCIGGVILYDETIKQENGEVVYFDRFSGTLAGGTPRGENQSINFSLNNIFQAKIKENDQEIKRDLFSWRLSTSNNLVLDEYNWGNLNSSLRANIRQKLNLDFSMTHDWYDFDSENNVRINKIRKSGGIPSPRLILSLIHI